MMTKFRSLNSATTLLGLFSSMVLVAASCSAESDGYGVLAIVAVMYTIETITEEVDSKTPPRLPPPAQDPRRDASWVKSPDSPVRRGAPVREPGGDHCEGVVINVVMLGGCSRTHSGNRSQFASIR